MVSWGMPSSRVLPSSYGMEGCGRFGVCLP